MKEFKDILKELRISKKLTQAELSNLLEINRTSISKYENGRQYPELTVLKKMADFFEVPVDQLLGAYNENFVFDKQTNKEEALCTDLEKSKKQPLSIDEFIDNANAMFLDVSEDDRDQLYRALSEIYFDSKAKNKEKYNPKKNKEK